MPSGLERIAWKRVQHIEEGDDGQPLWYEVGPAYGLGKRRRLLPGDVIHFGLGSDTEGCWNMSLIESCQHTLALHEAIMRHHEIPVCGECPAKYLGPPPEAKPLVEPKAEIKLAPIRPESGLAPN